MIGSRAALVPAWDLAGWTMLHFIWVGSLVAVLAALGRQLLRRAHPDVRYAYALASLTLLAAAPAVIAAVVAAGSFAADLARGAPGMEGTWSTASPVAQSGETVPARQSAAERSARTDLPRLLRWADVMVDILPGVWLVGAPSTFIYVAAGLWGAERLRRCSQPVCDDALSALCDRLADALGVSSHVAVCVCDRVAAPLVLGIARPLIVLPSALLTGWSPEQVELALLHELAHVRRWDNLVNLLQRVVESALFFHPAVWVLSGWVRWEREHCCDQIVVQHTGRALDYADALFLLAGTTAAPVAQASCMAEHHLVERIRRILNPEDRTMKLSRAALGLASGLLLLPAFLGILVLHANRRVMAQERNLAAVGKTSGKKVVMSTHSEGPARELPENPDLVGQLKLAIDAKDLEEVKRLMKRHPELHRAPLGYGSNGPLTYAVEWPRRVPMTAEKMAILRWMLENGSDVHQGGDGPLMRAALSDTNIRVMDLLVEHGGDVNAVWGGHYPIILAPLEAFAPRSLRWLLDRGADLHAAAKYCCPIEMLTCIYTRRPKDKSACLEIVGAAGFALPDTPVMALHRGRLDLLQEHLDRDPSLLERRFTYREIFFNLDGAAGDAYPATPVSGGTLLHLALEFDDIDVARWLIERGADVNARAAIDAEGFGGHTPLFHTVVNLAAAMGAKDDSRARLLLDHGADPNARATFRQEDKTHGTAPLDALHDVTPVGYARRYSDQHCVNAPALAAIIERGGKE
jgi:beta-lactamase regulating signal transducer with metallopeptidase domain/ankyrin repeat protein